jgi:CHASE2 domain-containing sensor protein
MLVTVGVVRVTPRGWWATTVVNCVAVGVWSLARVTIGWLSVADLVNVGCILLSVAGVVTVQTLVPALALRRGLWTPLFPLAAATTLVGFAVLRVGGESDGLFIYAILFAPFALAAQLLLAGGEFGLRRVVDGSR